MSRTGVTVHGLAELEDALIELTSEVAGKNGGFVRSALMAASLPVLRDAKTRVPKDTGALENQIKRNRIKEPRAYSELVTIGVPWPQWAQGQHAKLLNNSYGQFVEMGTAKKAARPFLRPALESNRNESTAIFTKKLAGDIQRAAKKIGKKNAAAVASKVKSGATFIGPSKK